MNELADTLDFPIAGAGTLLGLFINRCDEIQNRGSEKTVFRRIA